MQSKLTKMLVSFSYIAIIIQSIGITPSDRSTVSPPSSSCGKLSYQDRVGYQIIRELQSSNELAEYLMGRQYPMWDNERKMPYKYVDHSKNYVNDYMTSYIRRLNPISTRNKDQCYMGVCLPLELGNLFPKDSSTYKRLISSEESLEHGINSKTTENITNFKKIVL